jgi:1,6-anhydro-N-acetylmuramate kinase
MIDELVEYKKAHYPNDRRRTVICGGTPHGTIRVEWLPPAAPGVDVKWETRLYGMVRGGFEEEAVRFLKRTRRMSQNEAMREVARIRKQLGMV